MQEMMLCQMKIQVGLDLKKFLFRDYIDISYILEQFC